eukprot:SAG31_NODE_21782_length_541_cov_0.628959_1_plen_26_part_01
MDGAATPAACRLPLHPSLGLPTYAQP